MKNTNHDSFVNRQDSFLLIQKYIQNHSGEYNKETLWEMLSGKTDFMTFQIVFDYLIESRKIARDNKGTICWIWNPELVRKYLVNDFFDMIEGVVSEPSNFNKIPDNIFFAKDFITIYNILTEERLELINTINNYPHEDIDSISQRLNKTKANVRKDIEILHSMGIITIQKDKDKEFAVLRKQYIVAPLVI